MKEGSVVAFIVLHVFVMALVPLSGQQQMKVSGEGETGPYELVPNWPQPVCGEGYTWGSTAGVWAVSPDRVFVFMRGCLPELKRSASEIKDRGPYTVVPTRNASGYSLASSNPEMHPRWDHVLNVFDRNGKLVESWEQHNKLFVRPHRVMINPYDPDQAIWLVDDGAHQIFKFTHDGKKLLMTLGEHRKPGNDKTHFDRPTDIAWLPDGTFFVSDGYENHRVVKFSKDGEYLMEWGKPGSKRGTRVPYEFDTVHGITIDNQRRVYVIDRSNSRLQIFDENGKFLEQWVDMRLPYYIYMASDHHLWVSDGATQKILKYDLNGNLRYSWGTFGAYPGDFWGVHQFDVDSEGNLYTADVHVGRPQKFRPRAGADRANLIPMRFKGQMGAMSTSPASR